MEELTSTSAVMDKLGGTKAVAKLTGRKYTAAWNWRKQKSFPSDTADAMRSALEEKHCAAPASLWRMVEPNQ